MRVELDHARGARARWGFSLGCARAATALRIRATLGARDRGAGGLRAALLGTVAAALALGVYGPLRYPGLRAGTAGWEPGVLVVTLIAYALGALTLLRGTTRRAASARRRGVLAGVAIAAAWLLVLTPGGLKAWVPIPLAIAVICPLILAAASARSAPRAGAGLAAALWSGLVGGLLVFVTRATATYLDAGRPYDPQLVRDFHRSGAHDLASYAVHDGLDTALTLLLLIPVLCLALGWLGGQVGPVVCATNSAD
jgi:hypothetical protein